MFTPKRGFSDAALQQAKTTEGDSIEA